jgi:hypothetical protein
VTAWHGHSWPPRRWNGADAVVTISAGSWPFPKSLYEGQWFRPGLAAFTNSPASDLTGESVGSAHECQQTLPGRIRCAVKRSVRAYVAPLANHRVVAITNGVLTLFGGEPRSAGYPVILGANNKVTNLGTGKLTMTIHRVVLRGGTPSTREGRSNCGRHPAGRGHLAMATDTTRETI